MSVEMKDSGIAWIGEIPKHWNISKVSNHYNVQLGKMLQPKKELSDDKLENYLCAANVSKNQLHLDTIKQMWMKQCERDLYSLKRGDLLVVEGGDVASCDILKEDIPNLYFQNALHRVRPIGKNDNRYLRYILLMAKDSGHIDLICNKATISHFTKDKFEKLVFLNVPKEEQSRIANFLDKKCVEIDELIALQEQMIAQLNTYKQAVITETVTKGLNPDVKMKDSGVEWIGEIPEHWEIKELKFALDGLCDGTHGTFERVNHGELLLSAKNIGDNDIIIDDNESQISFEDYKKIVANGFPKKGDVLLCCVGSIGKCCLYKEEKSIAFQRSVAFLRHNSTITSEYLMYLLKSNIMQAQYDMYARKSAQSGIYMGLIKDFIIITPNAQEQKNLADYLDQKCKEIDELISIKKEKIEQLKAYKKSVIYEYVTGKKHIDR